MGKNKFLTAFFLILVLCVFLTTCGDKEEITPQSPQDFDDISANELMEKIRIGWNLGNTLETHGNSDTGYHWLGGGSYSGTSVSEMETAWGNPQASKANINALNKAGFNAVRIPVTWYKAVSGPDYKIRADWMRRVISVVNYAAENDMYIILNTHHDEHIFKFMDNEMEKSKKAFQSIWEQIALTFINYNEKLIFEGLNEPRTVGGPGEWNGGTPEQRDNLNILEQLFVDTVRATGGNNEKRILIVSSYAASAEKAAMDGVAIPDDPLNSINKIIVSIHSYTPYAFALSTGPVNTWNINNLSDTSPITMWMDYAFDIFISKGIPVVGGEFAANAKDNEEARAEWAKFYVGYAKSKGIKCFWWDDGGNMRLLNRGNNSFHFPLIKDALMSASQ